MSVRCVLLAVAIVVLRINGAPTDTGYFLTSNLAVISNEAGLTASNTDNGGVSFAIGETAKSKTFAIGVQNDNFMFGVKVSEPVLQCYFTVTVTNPKTGYDTSTKIKLEVNEATGLAYLASPLPLKFFGSFEDNFAQFVVKSDGKMGLGPVVSSTKTVVFAAYNLARLYDAAHRFFLITLSWESLPALSEVVFKNVSVFDNMRLSGLIDSNSQTK
uniref:Cadherin domain-containing protein n=1 Tax=Panagrellus redivivus TaxID=6233 RepID=A0A7E4ZUK0_PANRE